MPKNEFERKVREELERLQLKPSDEVWNQVSSGIQPAKRRRRWLIWIPFLFIGFAGGSYWFFNGNSSQKTSVEQNDKLVSKEVEKKASSGAENADKNDAEISSGESNPEQKKPEMSVESNDPDNEVSGKEKARSDQTTRKLNGISNANGSRKNKSNENKMTRNAGKLTIMNDKPEAEKINKNGTEKTDLQNRTVKDSLVNDTAFAKSKPVSNENETSTDSSGIVQSQAKTEPTGKSDSVANASNSAKSPSFEFPKWEYGVTVRGGYSNVHSDFFLLNTSRQLADYNSGSGTAYPQAPGYMGDSLFRESAFSWGAGFYVQRNINSRLAITGGLTYHQYNFQIRVGSKVDSTVFVSNPLSSTVVYNFYRGGTSKEYKNRFHYIEIPLAVSFQLNKGKNLPIRWDAGVTPGFLVSSDFLYPDFAQNIYYRDNSILRKMQWSVQTGFTIGLLGHQKHSLQIGPQVQYMFTNLVNDDVSKQHLGFVGLRANLKLWNSKPMQRSATN